MVVELREHSGGEENMAGEQGGSLGSECVSSLGRLGDGTKAQVKLVPLALDCD